MASSRESCPVLPNRNIFLICLVFCLNLRTSVDAFICSSKMNVGFAVDGSSKMGKENFASVIQFVTNASTHLDVGLDKTWMFLAYGNHKKVFKTKSDLVSLSPEDVEFPNASHVRLGSLLNTIRQQLHDNASERGAVSVVVLMTAPRSEDDIAVPAVLLKESAVTTITVGVGSEYSEGQLREIASDPAGNHVMKINSWAKLTNNLALHLAQQICQVVDRCVSSPCRNNGTCKSFNSGYNCTCSPEFYGTHCEKSRSVEYLSMGCFRDDHGARVIPSLERPNATFLDGDYQTREKAVIKCALEAAKMGYNVFALQDGGACHSGPNAHLTFNKHGSISCPSQGKGGSFISEVYLLGAKCGDLLRERLIHLSTSTIVGSSYNNSRGIPVLNGSYSWCPEDSDLRPQLTIDLGRGTLMTVMYLQGERDAIHQVDNVCVNFTYQGAGRKVLQENSSCMEFGHGMSDISGNLIHSHRLFSPLLVRSVVLSPTQPGQCLRTELKGCVTTISDEENSFEGCFKTERRKCCVFPFWYRGREVYSCIRDNHNQPWCANTDSYDRDQLWDNCQGVTSPCDTNPCLNGGICRENLTEWSYQCICNEHFTNDNCQDDFDECYNSLCQNGGTCLNTFGGYKCECNQGYSGKNCQLGCTFNTIELGFLLDSSASVNFHGANNFQEMKDFMKNLTKSFNISSTETRVGVIAFSTNSTLELNLNQNLSYQEISQAIDKITYYEGGTFTGNALREAITKLFSNDAVRPNIPKVLVIITDGVSTDDVVQPSLEVTQAGIVPYVIGVGDACDLSQLTQMALGKSDRVFLTKFGRLEDIVSGIRGTICRDLDKCADNPCHFGGICNSEDMSCTCQDGFQGPACTEDVEECSWPTVSCVADNSCIDTFGGHECTCADTSMYGENCTKDCTKEAIVLFLLDSSRDVKHDNIRLQVEFIISVASTLSYKQIGVVSYSRNAHFVIRPRQNTNFAHFAETLRAFNYSRGREKNLGRALITAMEESELTNSSKPVVVIAMTAGKTEDEHAVPSAIFQSRGATIVGLSLGSDYSLSQLNLLATKPNKDHILLTNFTELKQFVSTTRNKICQAVNPCSSVQCPSSKICVNSYGRNGGYECITHVCEPNPCQHGGNCTVSGDGMYHCDCPSGIGGQNCTEDTANECDSQPCVNGGTCRDLLGDFECECPVDYSGKHCELGCVTQKFNLVFVVDGSTSIEYQGEGNFQRSKDFIIEIVRSFKIGKYDTNVAVVLYSEKAQVIFKLDKYYNKEDAVEAIEKMPYPRGGTKTGKALDKVHKDVLNKIKSDRKDLPKVVLVLTDGLSQDDVRKPAEKLRDEGAKIISLGVGCCFDESELNEMATDPDEDHVLEVSFSELDNLRGIVRNRICTAIDFCSSSPCANGGSCVSLLTDFSCNCPAQWQGKDCSIDVDECASQITHCHDGQVCHNFPGDSTCLCQNNRYGENCTSQCQIAKFDVGFLLDSSGSINDAGKYNYQIMKDFIKAIVRSFIVSENDTRIAVATYSSLFNFKMRFDFSTYSSTVEIVDAIQGIPYDGGFTFTGYALSLVKRNMIPLARVGVPRILIVLTDGRSYDSVRDPSKALREEGVHIISVGVGNAVQEQLEEIATDPDSENVFMATFHSAINLVGSILEDVCRVVDHCSNKPCRNSGTCLNELNDYRCTCLAGYYGRSCEVVDHCYNQPCSNGGTCTTLEDSFTCECENGWTGPTCDIDIDECFNNPCINNATSCKNTLGSFKCDCQSGYTGTYCQIGIFINVFDVAFIIDGSSYIGIENFRRTLRLAKAILSIFKVSQQETNVAVSVYASRCIVSFNFQEKYSEHDVSAAIDSAPFLNEADLNIEKAFFVSKEQIFTSDRAHVPDVLIVFVSSSLSGSLTEIPQDLRDQGVTIIAVGVGDGYVPGQLETIASRPAPDHVITIRFRDMDIREGAVCGAISQAVDSCASYPCWNGGDCTATPSSYTCLCLHGFKGSTCEEDVDECVDDQTPPCDADKTCINTYGSYECTCSGNQYGNTCQYHVDTRLDLAFLIDGSQAVSTNTFNIFLWFIKSLTVSLDVSEDGTHVGVVVYGNFPKVVINFDDHNNPSSLGRAVGEIEYPASPQSNMGKALLLVPSKLYNSSAARQDAKRVLVILTASICQDNVGLPSFELQSDYAVAVYVIGVGNQYSLGQLREVASDPDTDHVITIDSAEKLSLHLSIFRDTLAEGLEPCSSNPCQHGTCKRSEQGYICTCFSGFSGQNCEQVNDPCHPEPCKNNGTCKVQGQNLYSCTCLTGWTGFNCDEDIKECSNPLKICHNEGTCYDRDGDYSCYCEVGFAGKKCDKVWKEEAIDLAFMIDGSSSINLWGDDNFAEITNATNTLISSLHSSQTRIGLVLFTSQAEVKIHFNSTMAKRQEVLSNLSSLPGTRNIGKALNATREHLFNDSRPNAHRVLLCFTHGTSNDDVTTPVKLLHEINVTVIVIALGDWYDKRQVEKIASDPDSKHLLTVKLSELGSLSWYIQEMILKAVDHCFGNPCKNNGTCTPTMDEYKCMCSVGFTGMNCDEDVNECTTAEATQCDSGKTCINMFGSYQCVCSGDRYGEDCQYRIDAKQDLVFLTDGSQVVTPDIFTSFLYFIKAVTASLNVSKQETHVSVASYGDTPHIEFDFNDYLNHSSLEQAVDDIRHPAGRESNMGEALSLLSSRVYNSSFARHNVTRVLIVLAASTSTDNVSVPSSELRKAQNVVIFAVGVGDQYNKDQLKGLASDPDSGHVITLRSADDLSLQSVVFKEIMGRALNPCSSDPCHNGTCSTTMDGYTCTCYPGFTGMNCKERLDHCSVTPCQNNGTCHNHGNDYKCKCQPGFTGKNCEEQDQCVVNPCRNNGTCVTYADEYRCNCSSGYTGKNCEEMDYCSVAPCKNNGTCHNDVDGYKCSCQIGYSGNNCQDLDECLSNPCKNNGTCHSDQDTYNCTCSHGYTGKHCEEVDNCSSSPCRNNATCHSNVDGYNCTCSQGFTGKHCEEGDHCSSTPCRNNATCHSDVDGYNCTCQAGFYGSNCEELDYCLSDPCKNNGTCQSNADEYICICLLRYTGKDCEVEDHCSEKPCKNNGTCHNAADDYNCICQPGFTGKDCEEVDHCSMTPCRNNGTCHNDGDDYKCICTPGFSGKDCKGVDYCLMTPCKNNGTCHNDVDEYKCTCLPAYTGRNCEEKDSCSWNPCKNNGTCHIDADDYKCICPASFTGKNCEEVDHCLLRPCRNNGTCHNDGKNYNCTCLPGFSGNNCEELDRCSLNPCKNNGTCHSYLHEYKCSCPSVYTGTNCEDANLCQAQPCKNGGTCTFEDTNFECQCMPGWTGSSCEDDVDECFNNPCLNEALGCENTLGSYECNCSAGFTGIHCQIGILTNMIDIVFLFDGSANMGEDNFHRILDFANNVLAFYNISQNQTNVAAAVYADNVIINFTFTEHYTSSAAFAAIEGLPFLNETTLNITKALYATKADILMTGRDNAPDILVIFASNKLSGDFTGISKELRQQWVTIVTVGVGDGYDLDQLNKISNKPAEDYVITTTVQHMDIMEGVACGAISQAADRCAKSPCRNGGQCSSNRDSSYSCSCPAGYTGPTCEQDIDECTDISKPKCTNGTSCVNTRGSYECVCIGSQYGEDCQYKMDTKLDLAFLIDGSQVVTKDNFLGFLFFIKSVTTSLNVNSEETHVGVAIYGDATKMVIDLDQYSNQSSLNAALDGVEYPGDRQSNMGLALSDIGSGLYNTSAARPNAKRMLVILTASTSQDDVSVPSYQLVTYYHVTIFVIGIGTHYSPGQLNEFFSRPDSDHVISLSSGVELSFFITVFKKTLATALDHCSSEPCQHGRCSNTIEGYSCSCNPGFTGRNCENDIDECEVKTCEPREICINFPGTAFCNCKAGTFNIKNICQGEYTRALDIGFVLFIGKSMDLQHKGNLRKETGFVKGLAKTFKVASHATRVGIVTYSNEAMVRYRFSDLMNQSELEVALDDTTLSDNGRNVGEALEVARSELFNQSEVGRNVSTPKILVVITDGSSEDDLAASSYALKRDNITVFAIGVDRYVRGQLYEMASEPNTKHVFTSVSYDEIGQTMALLKDAIIKAVEPCSTAPCANSATCVDRPGGRYSCLCSVGWTGEHCDVHDTPCTDNPHPCNNHGNCSVSDSKVTQCTCEPGWNGTSCEDDINECLLSPCLSDGNCTNIPGSYQCQCPVTYSGDNCETSCDYQRINIAFLVDGSASVELSETGNFNKTLGFVKSFIAGLNVSKHGANVAFAVFSSEYRQVFGFGLFNSSEGAVAAVVNASYPNQGRKIGNALNHARHTLFSHQSLRENVSNYLVLLTLGASYDFVKTPARTLREMNITIFAVGIGKDYDLSELEEITGGNGTQVYETNFDELENLQKHLKKEICQLENKEKCSSSPCLNGGSCINIGKLFRCECSRGYYGRLCQFGCGFRELGLKLPSTRRIPDSDMTSSSQNSEGQAAYRGRVGIEAMGSWEDGWCSSEEDLSPYIQIFFGYLTNVTVIETEGVTDANTDLWVESFFVSMSNTSAPESFVNYTEQGETHIFSANDNIKGKNVTLQGTSAHYIRIHPLEYHGLSACMRIAMYGCDTDDFPSSGVVLERVDNSPTGKATVFDTRLAVIPVVVFVALMTGSIIFFIRSFRQGKSNKYYSTLQPQQNQEESIYQTIPFDLPLYEVQTVTVELGPDQMLEVEGIRGSSETSSYALGANNDFIQNYQNNEYYIEEENYYETVFSSEMSLYEEQTLTIEMSAEATVKVESIFSQENKIFGFDRQING